MVGVIGSWGSLAVITTAAVIMAIVSRFTMGATTVVGVQLFALTAVDLAVAIFVGFGMLGEEGGAGGLALRLVE